MPIEIQAKYVASGEVVTFTATPWVENASMFVKLPKSDMVAELDLRKPSDGWLIYPN